MHILSEKFLVISFIGTLAACSTTERAANPTENTFYKRDIKITHNGSSYNGTAVLPESAYYDLSIEARGNLDLFTLQTCHREHVAQDAGEGGIFGNRRRVKYGYRPTPLEKNGACPVELGGYEKIQGRHSWGFVEFKDSKHKLRAQISCNGKHYGATGVSVCQSREGLIQEIQFSEPVKVFPDKECDVLKPKGNGFEYSIMKGACIYVFKGESGALHRHTTLGYEDILIRGNQ
jgi:hypothetical protein